MAQRLTSLLLRNNSLLVTTCLNQQQTRTINKHFNPKWKRQRREKYLKAPLPDFEAMRSAMNNQLTPAEVRAFMRQRGVLPYAPSSPVVSLSDSGQIFDAYVPKEDDAFVSNVKESFLKKAKQIRGKREIKKFDEEFTVDRFAEEALAIYLEAHELLTRAFPRNFRSEYEDQEDYFKLLDLVSEFGWPQMTGGLEKKTLVWKYVESLEPAKVVHVTSAESKKQGNSYAQATVRFHSKQIMAVYDRFGRLIFGSNTVPKDTLDYVVFEKHISDTDGRWRIHGKIQPSWSQHSDKIVQRTINIADFFVDKEDDLSTTSEKDVAVNE